MTSKEKVLARERNRGRADALEIQNKASEMTGTELNAADDRIPSFVAACKNKNMIDRPIGFVCKSTAGRVVKLLQPYNSTIYTQEPEELPAQWGFVWSKDPTKALPFIALSTSPYMIDECCSEDGKVYVSLIDNNTWAPSAYSIGWKQVE